MTLHPAIGSNRYCGPGALAILSGLSTGETAKLLRELTGRRAIMRIGHDALLVALGRLGIPALDVVRYVKIEPRPPLWNWALTAARGTYLVSVTGHFVVVEKKDNGVIEVTDNLTIYPITLAKFWGRQKRVRRVSKVGEVGK